MGSSDLWLIVWNLMALALNNSFVHGKILEFQMVYKYSEQFKEMIKSTNYHNYYLNSDNIIDGFEMPNYSAKYNGSLEFHQMLLQQDIHRHRHYSFLQRSDFGSFAASLAPSNHVTSYPSLGGLHYTFITIGTPGATFLVALDTGSELLWVPCDCQSCSSTIVGMYGLQSEDINFPIYDEKKSSTSKYVLCKDPICSSSSLSSKCSSETQKCNYRVDYVSTETSSSGLILEDVLHLKLHSSSHTSNTTTIKFGCGELQTGELLEGAAPNGLLGLGPSDISIPSTLSRNGLARNSFSMCFSSFDSSGRLIFGNIAPDGIQSTSLVKGGPSFFYILQPTKLNIGQDSIPFTEYMTFDTGTSYTTLTTIMFKAIGDIFYKRINLPRYQVNGTFNYCWNNSDPNYLNKLPNLTITFASGSSWEVVNPYTYINDPTTGAIISFCLGIMESSTNIIGHNFMRGYEVFIDQETKQLSWQPANCYDINTFTSFGSKEKDATPLTSSSPSTICYLQLILYLLVITHLMPR